MLKGFSAHTGLRLCIFLGLAFLTACVRLSAPPEQQWSARYGSTVIGEGFDSIAERHLEPVTMADLALNGLAGLRKIDAALDFELDAHTLVVRRDGATRAQLSAPATADSESWVGTTVAAIDAARTASPTLNEIDAEGIFRAVFDGALAPLDKFSRYADAATAHEHRALRDGFGGIGVTIRMEQGHALVIEVGDEGPAKRAGVLVNDRVIAVDGRPVAGWTQHQLVDALRGYVGTPVALTVERDGLLQAPMSLVRDHIVPSTVALRRDGVLAVIRVSNFNQDTAERVRDLIGAALDKPGVAPAGFVLDLRANPGGLLNRAVEVADLFVDRGQIVNTAGRHRLSVQSYPATPGDATGGRPLIVLINGNSASAAEVVAAALQDLGRAVVVGTTSYGKGTVQSVIGLPNDGELTLTWSRLLAPSGYRLHELGVLPTLCTHGGGAAVSTERLIDDLHHGVSATADRFLQWRTAAPPGNAQRDALRAVCPADGSVPPADLEVARALVADPALYRQALRLSDTAVARR
jgi:carboxyl-terminal processing protease